MNGAESLVRTLIQNGIEVCFANPGTSEMHFVAALDRVQGLRCILGLHETIVTGAADGYARMAEKPAATLLHTGPGLANGLSNLHNARKSWTPVVNVVGEHALNHIEFDAPLTSDIEGIARPVSHWINTPTEASALPAAGAEAVRQANLHPGHIATLILPANTAWEETRDQSIPVFNSESAETVDGESIHALAAILRSIPASEPTAIILGGHALRAEALEMADRIAQQCQATLLVETFKARFQRGEGRVMVQEIPYNIDAAINLLEPFKHIVTVCAKPPVGFFAYPDKPSKLFSENAVTHTLAGKEHDALHALHELASALDASALTPRLQSRQQHVEPEEGPLNIDAIGAIVANQLPDDAIVIDEAITSGMPCTTCLASAARHDWLEVCGGSIGGGMPLAVGAAIACPERQVINLQADGSAMYSLQALWTQAREKLNVVTVLFANSSYAILKHELDNVQAESGRVALDMMELDRPTLDWVALGEGMGVPTISTRTVNEFRSALETSLRESGPYLIAAII
ncbi:MAG: acetolactate synthase large subunit [Granulosicoccus sp.]|nr:acetolactate synthase large subunit [Granulosicoccus sp.]